MKCPKCNYLGFETGDRCKNCGYDFSLIDLSPPDDVDVDLTLALPATYTPTTTPSWAEEVDRALGAAALASAEPEPPAPAPAPIAAPMAAAVTAPAPTAALPLFTPAGDVDDEPLIKLPAAPRPPLAVRKTPDIPRLRAVPKLAQRVSAEPALEFVEEPVDKEEAPAAAPSRVSAIPVAGPPSARLAAAAIDHAILASIDAAVIYLTLRMAALTIGDWPLLPLAPLGTFLLLLKASYFGAFTAIGGQTIGKMAMGIRVVTDEGEPVDAACAIRRTLAGTVSTVVLGLGFVPALIGPGGRALHDYLAHTRVVDLHSA